MDENQKKIAEEQKKLNEFTQSFAEAINKFKQIKADYGTNSPDCMSNSIDCLGRMLSNLSDRLNYLSDSFYNHLNGHVPQIKTAQQMENFLSAIGAEGDYNVQKPTIWMGASSRGAVLEIDLKPKKN